MTKGGLSVIVIIVGLAAILCPAPPTGAGLRDSVARLAGGNRVEAAQKPPATPSETKPSETNLTATSANVSEAGLPVKIRILRWSTDEERGQLVAALAMPRPQPAPVGAGATAGPGAAAGAGAPAGAEAPAGTGAPAGARGGIRPRRRATAAGRAEHAARAPEGDAVARVADVATPGLRPVPLRR